MSIVSKLAKVQQQLKAPKGQTNKFGGYKYRNCEDILEALKPLLGECIVTIADDIQVVGERVYVKATAVFSDGENKIETSALAREPLVKKGMDESQITGAASSYARKYALNGLFLIDDTKDSDSHDNTQYEPQSYTVEQKQKFDELFKNQDPLEMFIFSKTFNTQDASSSSASAWVALTNSFEHGQKTKMGNVLSKLLKDGRDMAGELFTDLRKYIHQMDDIGIHETLYGPSENVKKFLINQLTAEEAKYLNEVMQ